MGRKRGAYKKRDRAENREERPWISKEEMGSLENPAFTRYYQGTVIPADQWDACIASFRSGLPSCFRINTSLAHAALVRDMMQREMANLTPVDFVPDTMAFQVNASRGELKRDVTMKHTKQLMVCLSAEGLLSRQEAVSMIPPLMLDVKAGHRVIDMCAAPGSKTTQILERLVAQGPGGVVVANDVNQGRLDVLTHQTARLPDAKSRLIITNHDATAYPLVSSAENKFDRVLCDVMCSGDGTLRKSMDLWPRWHTLMGPHLHASQSRVLMKGMGLCKQGGMVVYSTCSLNPVEDEAVIARCLQEADGAFELIQPSELMSGLTHYDGMHSWRLLSPDGETELTAPEEADGTVTVDKARAKAEESAPAEPVAAAAAAGEDAADGAAAGAEKSKPKQRGKARFTYTASMFPPAPEVAASLHLERCVRVAPHLQDTGGFFIAALRCVRELPNTVSSSFRASKYEPPVQRLPPEILADVRKGVTLPDDFPFDRLFCGPEASRVPKVYFLSKDAAEFAGGLNAKVVQMGVKVFESFAKKSWSGCRIVHDGAATIAPLLGDLVACSTAERVLTAIEKLDVTGKVQNFTLAENDYRSTVATTAPATLPLSGVLQVDCGETFGRIFLPVELAGNGVTVRFTATQRTLLMAATGRRLVAPDDAANADDDSAGSGDDDVNASQQQQPPQQPSAEP